MFQKFRKKVRFFCLVLSDQIRRVRLPIKVHSTEETLEYIKQRHVSISRFGDGEFNLAMGRSLKFQNNDLELSQALQNLLKHPQLVGDQCVIAIPAVIHSMSGFTLKSRVFWIKYFAQFRKDTLKLLDRDYTYFDAQITRIYINRSNKKKAQKYFEMWKDIWRDKNVLLVEGEFSRFGVSNDLLSSAKTVRRVICPARDAFHFRNDIVRTVQKQPNVDLVLLVLGPTATILAPELSKLGFWALDCGNMDMEYEWLRQEAHAQVAVENKFTIEADNGEINSALDDPLYTRQIVSAVGIHGRY